MNKYFFGDISLPYLETISGYPYVLIVKTNQYYLDTDLMIYWLCFSDQPFYSGSFTLTTGLAEEGIAFGVNSNILLYQALSESTKWNQITPQYNTEGVQWIKVGNYEDYIWSSNDITDHNTGEVKFSYYAPTLITDAAEQPELTYLTSAPTYEIFDKAGAIICQATSPDEGTISYKWYEYGAGLVSDSYFFTPPTYIIKEENGEKIATIGSKVYYCIIINSKNNTRTFGMVSVTLTINDPTPILENNFNFTLGQLLGHYARRMSITDEKAPQVDLDFENYVEDASIIQNKGTAGAAQDATVVLNSGKAYCGNKGLVLTKDANFYIPTDIIFNIHQLKLGTAFTYMVAVSDYSLSNSSIQRICLGSEGQFLIFYNKELEKFTAKLVQSPYEEISFNSEIVTNAEEDVYVFDIKAGDIVSIVHDTQEVHLYINDKWAMKTFSFFIFYPDSETQLQTKLVSKIGCGDIENSGNVFEQLTIKRFLYYDYALSKSQIKSVVDDIKNSSIDISGDKDDGVTEPVAYLYNGVRLPGLPVLEYPHALIVYNANYENKKYRLYAAESEAYFTKLLGITDTIQVSAPRVEYYSAGEVWTYSGTTTSDGAGLKLSDNELVWANFDILSKDDNSVYFSGTDPVPVYE